MLAKTSSATKPAREKIESNCASFLESKATHTPVTTTMAGTTPIVIRVSFHCEANATTKAATKVDALWIVSDSFSEIPWLTIFDVVVTLTDGDPASLESK